MITKEQYDRNSYLASKQSAKDIVNEWFTRMLTSSEKEHMFTYDLTGVSGHFLGVEFDNKLFELCEKGEITFEATKAFDSMIVKVIKL